MGEPAPYVLCRRPSLLRSPDKGVACHKMGAETWYERRLAQGLESGLEAGDRHASHRRQPAARRDRQGHRRLQWLQLPFEHLESV